jgi:hypothetical protein
MAAHPMTVAVKNIVQKVIPFMINLAFACDFLVVAGIV